MSHVVTLKTKILDVESAEKAAQTVGATFEKALEGRTLSKPLYDGSAEGIMSVGLRDWRYPVVVDKDGTARYDNYGGTWGAEERLDEFNREYARETATAAMSRQGWRLQTQSEENGELLLNFVN